MTDRALLARYPFLPGADVLLEGTAPRLEELVRDPSYGSARLLAKEGLERALEGRAASETPRTLQAFDAASPEIRVLAFLYTRMLVAAAPSPLTVARRWGEGEARRHGATLGRPDAPGEELAEVAQLLALTARPGHEGSGEMVFSLPSYVQLAGGMRDPEFRLALQSLSHGEVTVRRAQAVALLQEGIRTYLLEDVALLPLEAELRTALQQREEEFLRRVAELAPAYGPGGYGVVRPELFPPCMKELRTLLSQGEKVAHHGRFALASFMHKVGADVEMIVDSYRGASNFKEGITRYQVTQIARHDGGAGYTPPDCATLLANGLCFREKDELRPSLCADPAKLRNPLNYYRYRVRQGPGASPTPAGGPKTPGGPEAPATGAPSTSSGPSSTPSPDRPPRTGPSAGPTG